MKRVLIAFLVFLIFLSSYLNINIVAYDEIPMEYTFELSLTDLEISDYIGDDGLVYQILYIQDTLLLDQPGVPQLPFIKKIIEIPYNAVDISVNLDSKDSRNYNNILVYPRPKTILSTDDEQFYKNNDIYTSNSCFPLSNIEIVNDGFMRGTRLIELNIFPVTYTPAEKILQYKNQLSVKIQWRLDDTVNPRTNLASDYSSLLSELALNYKDSVSTCSSEETDEGSVRFLDGEAILDTDVSCDYLIITSKQLFYENALLDFANYRATFTRYDVVVVKTDDIYNYFPNFSNPDYDHIFSIKDFITTAYFYWIKAPQYLLLLGNISEIPSYQLVYPSFVYIDYEEWYVCVDGADEWPDITMGRIPVNNVNDFTAIKEKIVYYEQEQLYEKPFEKKAISVAGGCKPDTPVRDYLIGDGFSVKVFADFEGDDGNDIVDAINNGQDIVYYSGHGSLSYWDLIGFLYSFSIDSVEDLHNQFFPIFLTTACDTADLNGDSLGKKIVLSNNKGGIAYYGATNEATRSADLYIIKEIFDESEYVLGDAVLFGEFKFAQDESSGAEQNKLYILIGDPGLRCFGYPVDSDLPDLTISSDGVNYNYTSQKLTISILNVGVSDVSNVLVNVYVLDESPNDDILFARIVLDDVPANGELQTITVENVLPPVVGQYFVYAYIDPFNDIDESFKLNNINGKRIIVYPLFKDIGNSGMNVSMNSNILYTYRSAFSDVNGDGFVDILIYGFMKITANPSQYPVSKLYINNANKTFSEDFDFTQYDIRQVYSAIFIDIDNDGDDDLYLSRLNGNKLLRNAGNGEFEMENLEYASNETIFGDIDNDGDLDIYTIEQEPPHNSFYINENGEFFYESPESRGVGDLNSGSFVCTPKFIDMNDDGAVDLLIVHSSTDSHNLKYYQNDGSGHFSLIKVFNDWDIYEILYDTTPRFALSDIDRDGYIDVLYEGQQENEYDGIHKLQLYQQSDGSFVDISNQHIIKTRTKAALPLFLELDNMVGQDILAKSYLCLEVELLKNSGKGFFMNFEEFDFYTQLVDIMAALDFDNDGDTDLLINSPTANPYNNEVRILLNQINNDNFVNIKPVGTQSNSDGIGCKIYVFSTSDDMIGYQEITSTSPAPLHFGLDPQCDSYNVYVYWPATNTWDSVVGVTPSQSLTIVEGTTDPELFAFIKCPTVAKKYNDVSFRGFAGGGSLNYCWFWDFGDNISSDSQNPIHQYNQLGDFNVTLTVADSGGSIVSCTRVLTVVREKPDVPFISSEKAIVDAYSPLNFTTNAASSTDNVQFQFDWIANGSRWYNDRWIEDGSHWYSEWSSYVPSGDILITSNTWSYFGIYHVSVRARDENGVKSEWSTPVVIKVTKYDVDEDGDVDPADVAQVKARYNEDPTSALNAPADVNLDGIINPVDAGLVEAAYGKQYF